MSASSKDGCYSFITVRLHPEHGYFGGLLVVNSLARPMEFHCSLPWRPSRAQSILYGPTLDDFVCGEQIARALVLKTKARPDGIFVDAGPILSLRHHVDIPLGWVDIEPENGAQLIHPKLNHSLALRAIRIDDVSVQVREDYAEDASRIANDWKQRSPQIDLCEPFGRITEALLEAHPAAKAA